MNQNNPSPVPVHSQKFILPLMLEVDSDKGTTDVRVRHHIRESSLSRFLTEEFYDSLDRNSDDPQPFVVRSATIEWPAVVEVTTPGIDAKIEQNDKDSDAAFAKNDFDAIANIRTDRHALVRLRTRLAHLGLSPRLLRALGQALSYARSNTDDLNELMGETDGEHEILNSDDFDALLAKFGIDR